MDGHNVLPWALLAILVVVNLLWMFFKVEIWEVLNKPFFFHWFKYDPYDQHHYAEVGWRGWNVCVTYLG